MQSLLKSRPNRSIAPQALPVRSVKFPALSLPTAAWREILPGCTEFRSSSDCAILLLPGVLPCCENTAKPGIQCTVPPRIIHSLQNDALQNIFLLGVNAPSSRLHIDTVYIPTSHLGCHLPSSWAVHWHTCRIISTVKLGQPGPSRGVPKS